MLIIMCGYPKSGKSTFADLLLDAIKTLGVNGEIVRPSDWPAPDDVSTDEWNIAAWEYSLEKTTELLSSRDNSNIIILDTCAANADSLSTVIGAATLHTHTKIVMLMAIKFDKCAARIGKEILDQYKDRIPKAVMQYKSMCDIIMVIKDGSVDVWQKLAIGKAKQICQLSQNGAKTQ